MSDEKYAEELRKQIAREQQTIAVKQKEFAASLKPHHDRIARLVEMQGELHWGVKIGQKFRLAETARRDRGKLFVCAGFDTRWLKAYPFRTDLQVPTDVVRTLYFVNAGDLIPLELEAATDGH